MIGLHEHPQRVRLTNEVHARPPETLAPPFRASHIALHSGEWAQKAEHSAILELCAHFGITPPTIGAGFFSASFGHFRLRWERHTEFSTYTIYALGAAEDGAAHPFAPPALSLIPQDLLGQMPGQLMVATHIAVEQWADDPGRRDPSDRSLLDHPRLKACFGDSPPAGARVAGARGIAFSDFHIHEDGATRYLVLDRGLKPRQAGRICQRLLEIETYRVFALLGFPLAREMGPKVTRANRDLSDILGRMTRDAAIEADQQHQVSDEAPLLHVLTELAAEVERMSASSNYRFSAAKAYQALVRRRIQDLREERIEGLQLFAEFMDRRFDPAIATCIAVETQLDSLSTRVARASELLRTRVDVKLEAQNRDLLHSMNRRARLQLRLQETVEGLSVAVITYYVVSLIGYAAKGAKAAGWSPFPPELVAGLSILPVALLVWFGTHHLKRRIMVHDPDEEKASPNAATGQSGSPASRGETGSEDSTPPAPGAVSASASSAVSASAASAVSASASSATPDSPAEESSRSPGESP